MKTTTSIMIDVKGNPITKGDSIVFALGGNNKIYFSEVYDLIPYFSSPDLIEVEWDNRRTNIIARSCMVLKGSSK